MTSPSRPPAVTDDDHIKGPLGAPMTLVEYGDFECARSREALAVVHELIGALGDQLCYVFRNFPRADVHPQAEAAAEAAEAADALGGAEMYWEMHDMLFANQDALDEVDLVRYARDVGLDADAFADALESGEYGKRVRKDVRGGERSGVTDTPAFFINGERYAGDWTDVDGLMEALTADSPSP